MGLPRLRLPVKFNKHKLLNATHEDVQSPKILEVYHSELKNKQKLLQRIHSMIIKYQTNVK